MEVISSIYNSGYNIKKFYLGSRELNLAYLGNQVIYDEVIGDNDLNYILYEFYGSDTLPNTVEAPVKSAILKGSTKYRDIDTGEILETFEDGRNLELVSVKMPVLTTTGKNLYNGYEKGSLNMGTGLVDTTKPNECSVNFICIRGQKRLKTNLPGRCIVAFYDANKEFVQTGWHEYNNTNPTINVPSGYDLYYMRIRIRPGFETDEFKKRTDVMVVGENDDIVPYEPHKSNILTVNEDVELRGIGEVQDTLDLMTGEVTQRVGKTTITGDLVPSIFFWERNSNSETICFENFGGIIPFQWNQIISVDWLISNDGYNPSLTHEYFNPHDGYGIFRIKRSRLETEDANGFKKWLNENPITIYHPVIGSESIKTVDLTIVDQDGKTINKLNSFNGTTHVSTEVAENSAYPMVSLEVASELQAAMSKVAEDIELIKPVQNDIETTIDTQSNDIDSLLLATTELFEMFL